MAISIDIYMTGKGDFDSGTTKAGLAYDIDILR